MTWERPDWHAAAACKGMTDVFFPVDGVRARRELKIRAAQRICAACPVQDRCAEQAAQFQEHFGVWGGQPPRTRPLNLSIVHGTQGGYNSHRRRGEAACDACRQAHARAVQESKRRIAS